MLNKLIGLAVLMFTLGSTALPAQADTRSRACKPVEVAVFGNRLHVRCEPINGQAYTSELRYYAMKLDNSVQVQATLDLLLMAKANNRSLTIRFDENDYQSVPGCQGGDCRRLVWAAMR